MRNVFKNASSCEEKRGGGEEFPNARMELIEKQTRLRHFTFGERHWPFPTLLSRPSTHMTIMIEAKHITSHAWLKAKSCCARADSSNWVFIRGLNDDCVILHTLWPLTEEESSSRNEKTDSVSLPSDSFQMSTWSPSRRWIYFHWRHRELKLYN